MPKPVKFSAPKPGNPPPARPVRFDTSFDFGFNKPAKKGIGKKKPAGGAAGGS